MRLQAAGDAVRAPEGDEAADEDGGPLLLAPCRWFIARLYFDLLDPDDGFNTILRKMCVAAIMFASPMPFLFAVPAVLRVAENDPASTALSVSIVASLVMATVWIASYVVVRVTRKVTDFAIDAVGIGTALCSILQMTTLPDFPWLVCFTIVAAAVLLVATPRRNLVVSFWFVGYVIAAYTRVLRFEAGATRATLPGTLPETTPVGHFVNHLAGLLCVVVVLFIVSRYITETYAKQVAADAVVALASEVACQLKRYDTDAGEVTLATADSADGELVGSLRALLANLNMYRPHIPTWLLLEEIDDNNNRDSSPRDGDADVVVGSAVSHLPESPCAEYGEPAMRFGDRRERLISFAVLDCPLKAGKLGSAAMESALNLFSDVVHRQAALTRATIHDFTGDQLRVSWNTTHEVLPPQRGAVRFIRAVAKDAPSQHMRLSGAVCSGEARCQFAGSGSMKAFTVSMPWRETLRIATSFARVMQCFVVDGDTFDAVRDKFDGRAVEVFRVHAAGTPLASRGLDQSASMSQSSTMLRSFTSVPTALQLVPRVSLTSPQPQPGQRASPSTRASPGTLAPR
jgi:hypothetical protein